MEFDLPLDRSGPDLCDEMKFFNQRYDDAVFQQRVDEGRCGNCGAFDGPDHRCPEVVLIEWEEPDD